MIVNKKYLFTNFKSNNIQSHFNDTFLEENKTESVTGADSRLNTHQVGTV